MTHRTLAALAAALGIAAIAVPAHAKTPPPPDPASVPLPTYPPESAAPPVIEPPAAPVTPDFTANVPPVGLVAPVVTGPPAIPLSVPADAPGRVEPVVRLGPSSRVFTTRARCRSYAVRPARAVGPDVVPRYGQVRVVRGADGRWWGHRDRWRVVRVTRPDGRVVVRVSVLLGTRCGPRLPEVAG